MPHILANFNIDEIRERIRDDIYDASLSFWFYTVTLHPSEYHKTSRLQYNMSRFRLSRIVRKHTSNFGIVPEITKEGNVHYHFIAGFKPNAETKRFTLLNALKRGGFGFVKLTPGKIDTVSSRERVIDYLTKELEHTVRVLEIPVPQRPLVYHNLLYELRQEQARLVALQAKRDEGEKIISHLDLNAFNGFLVEEDEDDPGTGVETVAYTGDQTRDIQINIRLINKTFKPILKK